MRSSLTSTIPAAFAALVLGACSASSPASSASNTSSAPAGSTSSTVAVTIAGGHETVDVDNGRPVVLVAALLGVEPEVFRTAFSGVTPAKDAEPETAQVQANKAALLDVLGPYGVTNEALDAASNHYRYLASAGETWEQRDATATATVVDGEVTSITIDDPGRGYSSAPTATITLPDGTVVTLTATVSWTTDFDTNGSLTALTLSST